MAHRRLTAALAAVALAIGGVALAQPSLARTAPAPTNCSWWVETSTTTTNLLYPDSSAAYWTMPYSTDRVSTITLQGTYLDARYFAVQAYGADAQLFTVDGQTSALTDYEIVADPGSVNPLTTSSAAGGAWTVTLTNDPTVTGDNVLPLSPSTPVTPFVPGLPADTGFLMIRAYLPNVGFAQLPLPTVTLADGSGGSQTLPQCSSKDRSKLARTTTGKGLLSALRAQSNEPPQPCADPCPPELEFFRVGSGDTPFPNANSAYVAATFTPARGQVVVVRATMPTASVGTTPQVWTGGKDLRYWSFCNYVYTAPYPVVEVPATRKSAAAFACSPDLSTATAGGDAVIVLSFPSDLPRISRRLAHTPGSTWLPMSAKYGTTKELLALRNMLANPTFAESATNIPTVNSPSAAEAVMGEYYPVMGTCSASTFARHGVDGCLG